jgi:bla regulator protein blaR1
MNITDFVLWMAEAAVRSLALSLVVGAAITLARLKDVRARLSLWTVVLAGAVLMPVLVTLTPAIDALLGRAPVSDAPAPVMLEVSLPVRSSNTGSSGGVATPVSIWPALLSAAYLGWSLILLLRLLGACYRGHCIRRSGRRVPHSEIPAELRALLLRVGLHGMPDVIESERVVIPLIYGWRRPVLLLPAKWRTWDEAKRTSVFVHELSHIARRDFLRQAVANVHTVLFPFSPLSWWLRRKLADLCEQMSDDEAVLVVGNAAVYADVVLGFLRARRATGRRMMIEGGVAMSRMSNGAKRVERILNENRRLASRLSRTRRALMMYGVLAVVALVAAGASSAEQSTPGRLVRAAFAQVREASLRNNAYVYVHPDGASMDGTDSDHRRAISHRAKYGDRYLWFRRDGKEYVVTDRALLGEVDVAMEPQRELGRRQAELGEAQAKLGEQQAAIGEQQTAAAVDMPDLSAEVQRLEQRLRTMKGRKASQADIGDLQGEIGALQAKIGEIQAKLGEVSAGIGERQAVLGQKQAELGSKQAELGWQQERVAREVQRKIAQVLDRAVRMGVALQP